MANGWKARVKRELFDAKEKIWQARQHQNEIKKFRDPVRKGIVDQVVLTEEQKAQIDDLYQTNYGKKIPYTWHRYFTAFTGRFDPAYFPELLYIPEFEHYMNQDARYCWVFADKNVLPMLARQMGVAVPQTIACASEGIYQDGRGKELSGDQLAAYLADAGDVFVKPSVGTDGGRGCFAACFHNGVDDLSGKTVAQTVAECGRNFVIQEHVHCHTSIANLHPQSVNTIRVITYRWKDAYYHTPLAMRMGRGGNIVDNGHAGGIFVGVNDDGTLQRTGIDEVEGEVLCHPDTGFVFQGHRIEGVPAMLEAARKMCLAMPQIGCINWDFTIGENGQPLLIEANLDSGSIWPGQIAHGHGPFGNRTVEVLQWLKKMNETPPSERYRYKFGAMD